MFASRTDVIADAGNTLLTAMERTEEQPTWGFWARGYGNTGERTGNDVSSRYDYGLAGVTAGFDRKISDTFLMGLSTGYSQTKVTMKDLSDAGTVSSYQGSIYGAYASGPWYVDSIAAYGYNRYDTSRDISFGSIMTTANADYAGNAFGAYTEAGYRIKVNTISIIPLAGFQASYLMRNSFTERDAGALDLDVDSDHTSSFVSSMGIRLRKDIATDTATIIPELNARWLHEFSNDDYRLNAAFAGSPAATFTVQEDGPKRDSVALGFGLTCLTKKDLNLFVAYDATISGDRMEQEGSLGCATGGRHRYRGGLMETPLFPLVDTFQLLSFY